MGSMKFIAAIILILAVFASGCNNIIVHVPDGTPPVPTPQSPVVTVNETPNESYAIVTGFKNETPVPPDWTPTIPPVTPAPELFTQFVNETPTTVPPTPVKTRRTPKPTPVPLKTMNKDNPYLTYSDENLTISYPSNWTYEVLTENSRPNIIAQDASFLQNSTVMVFHGPDKRINLTITTTKLLVAGSGRLNGDFQTCADSITARFPEVSGIFSISDYSIRYTDDHRVPYIQFRVLLPENSASYPLEYTEWDMMSYWHFYNLRFNTPGPMPEYKNIRDYMILSLIPEDTTGYGGWIR